MNFQQIPPPERLRAYVRYFWTLESTGSNAAPRTFRTIADGCPGLMFQQAGHALFYDRANQKDWPRLFLYGQATKPGEIQVSGPFQAVGAYFHPGAVAAIFGFNAGELTDSCLELDLLPARHEARISERLLHAGPVENQVELLAAYLWARLRENQVPADHGMRYAVGQLLDSSGKVPLQCLQRDLQLSERSFQRRFKYSVGLPPQLFARICRFQVSMQQLRAAAFDKLSDIAFEHDYADQSHHIRAFKEFAGISPLQYRKQAHEVLENFPELRR